MTEMSFWKGKYRLLILAFTFVSITVSIEGKSRRLGSRRHCSEDPDMPLVSYRPGWSCDQTKNCRYGGVCWKLRDNSTSLVKEIKWMRAGKERCLCSMHCGSFPIKPVLEQNCVCGSDGRTYETECHLRQAACRCQSPISVMWTGSCEKGPYELQSPQTGREDDGSGSGDVMSCVDGVTCRFGGVCDSDSEDGPCLCKHDCEGSSSNTVCGSDGNSYFNECYLKERACEEQKDIVLYHEGPCSDRPPTSVPTTIPTSNPCDGIFCIHGACVPIGLDEFECSCDAMCDEDALLVQTNSIARLDQMSIRKLSNLLPDFQHRYYDDVQMAGMLPTEMTPTTQRPKKMSKKNKARRFKVIAPEEDSIPLDKEMLFDDVEDWILPDFKKLKSDLRKKRKNARRFHGRTMNARKRKRTKKRRRQRRSAGTRFSAPDGRLNFLINETVCGTDGKTYKDECQLRVHACYEKKDLKVEKVGPCPIFYKVTTQTKLTSTSPLMTTEKTTSVSTKQEKPSQQTSRSFYTTTELQAKTVLTARNIATATLLSQNEAVESVILASTRSGISVGVEVRRPWVIALASILAVTLLGLLVSFLCRCKTRDFFKKTRNGSKNTPEVSRSTDGLTTTTTSGGEDV